MKNFLTYIFTSVSAWITFLFVFTVIADITDQTFDRIAVLGLIGIVSGILGKQIEGHGDRNV